jgi:hypothetical protein
MLKLVETGGWIKFEEVEQRRKCNKSCVGQKILFVGKVFVCRSVSAG